MDLNKCMFIGNLTRDPETRTTPSGATVTTFSLAVNTKRGQNEEVMFLKVETWNKTAEIAAQYLQKGSQCLVEGRLKVDEYEAKDGSKRRDPVLVADRLSLGRRPNQKENLPDSEETGKNSYQPRPAENDGGEQRATAGEQDDLPF